VTRIGVVVFPGSNCEYDAASAVTQLGAEAVFVWHSESDVSSYDGIILPGGFAHGDYLRPGALARFSPVMEAVARYAADGGPVLGSATASRCSPKPDSYPGRCRRIGD